MTFAPSEGSDQAGHPPSLITGFACALMIAKDRSFPHVDSEDSDLVWFESSLGILAVWSESSLGVHVIFFNFKII